MTMDYSNIAFVLELNDANAADTANLYLNKGWLLIGVGTTVIDIVNGHPYQSMTYVLGATQHQYEKYLKEQENLKNDLI